MQLNKRILDSLCLAGLITLILVGSVVCVKLAVVRVKSVQQKTRVIDDYVTQLKKAQTVRGRLNSAIAANEAALTQIRTRLPESESMGMFLADLDAMMDKNKVDLSKVTPGSPVSEALCRRTPLSFSCRGNFTNLHAVLYGLETQQRVVLVDKVSIVGGASPGECAMDVSCSVYGR